MRIKSLSLAVMSALCLNYSVAAETHTRHFNRVSSFLICSQIDENCNTDTETAAEILYATKDGNILVYSDSPNNQLGIVDISDAANPKAKGTIDLGGEPTSVVVKDNYALVAVNTSSDYVNVSGELQVVSLLDSSIVNTLDLGGQPDSIGISPDGQFAAIAIENERDEDKGDGGLPQYPAGFVVIVDTADVNPANWTTRKVEMTGLSGTANDDPEPEYIDINDDNIAVVSMQENNSLALIDLKTGEIVNHFSAGTVDLTDIDLTEGKPKQISLTENKMTIPREPDGVSWIDNEYFATANEGDWKGGSRGFSIFNSSGEVVWDSGNTIDHMAVKFGHYPDKRSGNKGSEPENVEVGSFDGERLLFVNAERAGLVFVYNVDNPMQPVYKQVLPTGVGPEGANAIPSRNLLAVASEVDERKNKMRSVINLYELSEGKANYPTLQSVKKAGRPIAWSAMSGLAADADDANILYAVEDSFYKSNRIFKIDISQQPALIVDAMPIMDKQDVVANLGTFDMSTVVNEDKTLNLDLEGISVAADGGFWVVSEGKGTKGDEKKPFVTPNLLIKTDKAANVTFVTTLPKALNDVQLRFGFEGVAEYDGKVYVAFQRAWNKEANPRIGIFDPADNTWEFVFYRLDKVESQFGGWVGLSDITAVGDGQFYVLERDNQGGPDAAIKCIYKIDLSNVKAGQTVDKTLVRNLMDDLKSANGLVAEKVEGLAITKDGSMYIINDNDGVDDHSGETQLMQLK